MLRNITTGKSAMHSSKNATHLGKSAAPSCRRILEALLCSKLRTWMLVGKCECLVVIWILKKVIWTLHLGEKWSFPRSLQKHSPWFKIVAESVFWPIFKIFLQICPPKILQKWLSDTYMWLYIQAYNNFGIWMSIEKAQFQGVVFIAATVFLKYTKSHKTFKNDKNFSKSSQNC